MTQKFPYTPTPKALVQFIGQLRKSFPAALDAAILKKLGLAPNNESYVINVVRFLGLIDDKGKKNSAHQSLFSISEDAKFADGFSKIVKDAYVELFNLHGDEAWELSKPALSTFFRQSDGTSAVVGERQVGTFVALAEYSGRRKASLKPASSSEQKSLKVKAPVKDKKVGGKEAPASSKIVLPSKTARDIGVSVKVEVILPSDASKETYDHIFRSIRANLIDE